MRNQGRQVEAASKASYTKPAIREVKLRPEEAVLGNCKVGTSGGVGPAQSQCSGNVQCLSLGS